MTNVDDFRASFYGVRANRYRINAPMGAGVGGEPIDLEIYAKAISMPGTQIGLIPVSFQGRIIKFSGERQFGEWSMQVYDGSRSGESDLRNQLERWIDKMDGAVTHTVNYNVATNWEVLYDDSAGQGHPGNTMTSGRGFKLHHCWPIDVSPIDLSYEAVDSFAEFTLTVAYDYHTIL